jgi:SRSO17 transposase
MPVTEPATAPQHQDTLAVQGGVASLHDIERRLAPSCERAEPRQRALAYLRGLLSLAERKNSWQLAEVRGDATPYAFQHVLRRAVWAPEAVRAALRHYIVQHLGDVEAVLGLDETGFLKKGRHSAGVARQYRGTAGTVDNCQIGVFVGYASPLGQALLDRELSLPQEWINDRERRRSAGIPDDRRFATKPQLAQQMLARACAAGVPATWITGDSVYGNDRRLRLWLEAQPRAYVLAVSGQEYVWLGGRQRQVKTIRAVLPEADWTRLSAGDGTLGSGCPWRRWLLGRRRVSAPVALQAYVVFTPQNTTLAEGVRGAGTRWTLESCVEAAKSEVGWDHDEVRSWTGWYRHLTLAMWALALLVVLRAGPLAVKAFKKSLPPPRERSPLAAFKAGRGLASHGASRSVAGSSGAWSWRSSRPSPPSSPGHSGAGGTRRLPSMTTTSVVRRWLMHWRLRIS